MGLSSNTLDEFARQTGFKEISPSDSASQVGGDSSVLGSSATQGLAMREEVTRKREQKVQDKLENVTLKSVSNRSVTKDSVEVEETKWMKLSEQDKYRNTLY